MKFQLGILILLVLPLHSPRAQDYVTEVEDSLFSPSVNATMKFFVVLPPHYNENHERHPTLFLLHGFGGSRIDWIRRSELLRYLRRSDLIVITPDAKNGWYTNAVGKKNARYEDYIMNDLIPYVEGRYRTLGTSHGRAIAGLSMGGYGALKLALKYRKFYFVASLSGAFYAPAGARADNAQISESLREAFGEQKSDHWLKNDITALLDSVAVRDLPYIYLCAGKDDSFTRIVETNRAFAERLRQKGALYEFHETPGGHTWAYWDKELENLLRRLAHFDPLNP